MYFYTENTVFIRKVPKNIRCFDHYQKEPALRGSLLTPIAHRYQPTTPSATPDCEYWVWVRPYSSRSSKPSLDR